jgi:bacterioferritin (cytochrome b1)
VGETTDTRQLVDDLNGALPLLARDALAAAIAAGSLAGPEGVALSEPLRRMAADDVRDLERLAGRISALDGSPALSVRKLQPAGEWRPALESLVAGQRETLDALVSAIPADADDAEGEASEHLLEHLVARKRDDIELLERALR